MSVHTHGRAPFKEPGQLCGPVPDGLPFISVARNTKNICSKESSMEGSILHGCCLLKLCSLFCLRSSNTQPLDSWHKLHNTEQRQAGGPTYLEQPQQFQIQTAQPHYFSNGQNQSPFLIFLSLKFHLDTSNELKSLPANAGLEYKAAFVILCTLSSGSELHSPALSLA